MRLVVVVKRDGQVLQCGSDVRLGHPRNVVSLYRFDETFGHPVALRTSDRGGDGLQTDFPQERQRFLGNVAGTVIAEPLDFAVGLKRAIETVLHRLKHHLARHVPGVATRRRRPAYGFPVATVQCKDDAQRHAVIATEFEAVRAPAGIAPAHRTLALVPPRGRVMARTAFK